VEDRDVVVPAEVIRKIQEDFELDKYELATLFGISLRSATDWLKNGIKGQRGLNIPMIDCLLTLQLLSEKDPENFMTFKQLRGLVQRVVREPSLVFFQFAPYEEDLGPVPLLSLKHPKLSSVFMAVIFILYMRIKEKPINLCEMPRIFREEVEVEELVSAVKAVLQKYGIQDNDAIATKIVDESLSAISSTAEVPIGSIGDFIRSWENYSMLDGQRMCQFILVDRDKKGGKSIKPWNVILNRENGEKMLDGILAILPSLIPPIHKVLLTILIAYVICYKIYPSFVKDLTEKQIIAIMALDLVEKPVSEEEILRLINDQLINIINDRNDTSNSANHEHEKMNQEELKKILEELKEWRCVDRDDEGRWRSREKIFNRWWSQKKLIWKSG